MKVLDIPVPASQAHAVVSDPWRSLRRLTFVGTALIAVLTGTVGLWAATAPLASAVIANGRVVVESNVRKIQHPTGGVVARIYVHDGDHVKAGDLLLRLDDTNARATLALIETELHRLWIRKARLEAERTGQDSFALPSTLAALANATDVKDAMRSETQLFRSRRDANKGQILQLRERIDQAKREIDGVAAQLAAKARQKELTDEELGGVEKLYRQNLVAMSRLTGLQRDEARLLGEEGSLTAETARIRGRIAETQLQILQVDQDMRRNVSEESRDVEGKIADLSERRIAAADILNRVDIRAPQTGIVLQNSVHTIGGVVGPGEQIMLIVPEQDGLVVEARIDPTMIDRVQSGQDVLVRFPAFDAATTPTLHGHLRTVGADLTTDPATNTSFYTARVKLDHGEIARLDGKALVPGMPAEAFIQTGSRTALAYLIKPITDQLARAFRYD